MPTFTVHPVSSRWTFKREGSKTTGTTVYRVLSDTPTHPGVALGAAGIPAYGSVYPGEAEGSTLKCKGQSVSPDGESCMNFLVTLDYDSSNKFTENPLSEQPAWSVNGQSTEGKYFKDCSDPVKRAETTAGEPFPELPTRDVTVIEITMERNVEASKTYADYFPFADKINSGNVTINGMLFTDGQVKVGAPSLSAVETRNGYSYRKLTIPFSARADGWDQKFESRGLYELIPDYGLAPITDSDGNPVKTPWPLDADGAAMSSSSATGAEIVLKPYLRESLAGLVA